MDPLNRLNISRYVVAALAVLVIAGIAIGPLSRGGCGSRGAPRRQRPRTELEPPPAEQASIRRLAVGFPSPQTNLLAITDESVYMPTASGRLESALYGSTRTGLDRGGRAVPRFHAGIDIAPLERDRRGRARDSILAVADGKVAYANANAGNSNYGRYIVLEHDDAVGPVYTLYAHLASVAGTAAAGRRVERGDVIGVMGNSSSSITIPMERAHLHFEVCMMMNRRFIAWCEAEGLDTRHGLLHGWNLNAIDPLALYRTPDRTFSMLEHMRALSPAFTLVVRAGRRIDYFDMYPALWQGGEGEHALGTVVLSVCEGGTITAGRPAAETERDRLPAGRAHAVLHVDTEVLDRNGRGLVARRGDGWTLSGQGERWLSILLH